LRLPSSKLTAKHEAAKLQSGLLSASFASFHGGEGAPGAPEELKLRLPF